MSNVIIFVVLQLTIVFTLFSTCNTSVIPTQSECEQTSIIVQITQPLSLHTVDSSVGTISRITSIGVYLVFLFFFITYMIRLLVNCLYLLNRFTWIMTSSSIQLVVFCVLSSLSQLKNNVTTISLFSNILMWIDQLDIVNNYFYFVFLNYCFYFQFGSHTCWLLLTLH